MTKNDQRGVTLVELSIVLAVVGFLAALALPGILRWRQGLELRRAASEISGVFMQARTRSILERKHFRISFDGTADTYATSIYSDAALTTLVATESRPGDAWRSVDIYDDTTDAACPPFSGGNVVFRPNSSADTAGFEGVYLRSAAVSQRYRVKVLGATGKIAVERWLGGAWTSAF